MKPHIFLYSLVLVAMLADLPPAQAQVPASKDKRGKTTIISGTKPNSVRFFRTRYVFALDEYRWEGHTWYAIHDLGISYQRQFGTLRKHAIEIALDENFYTIYGSTKSKPGKRGNIMTRTYYNLALAWRYSFIREGPLSVETITGLSFKTGEEVRSGLSDGAGGFATVYVLNYRDPGAFAGLNLEYRIWPSFHVFATSYVTGILWRYAPRDPSLEGHVIPVYSPRGSLTFRLGIGYSFGKGLPLSAAR